MPMCSNPENGPRQLSPPHQHPDPQLLGFEIPCETPQCPSHRNRGTYRRIQSTARHRRPARMLDTGGLPQYPTADQRNVAVWQVLSQWDFRWWACYTLEVADRGK